MHGYGWVPAMTQIVGQPRVRSTGADRREYGPQSYAPLSYLLGAPRRVWLHRRLLWHLTVRNLRAQHKQSILGYAWLFLNPLTLLGTLYFIFSLVFKTDSQGQPFLLFLAVALFPWIFFSAATSTGTDAVVGSGSLVKAVYFPRDLLVISAVLIRLVDFLTGLVVLAAAFIYFSQPVHLTVLWFFPLFALQVAFTLGITLPLAACNAFFHDVRFFIAIVLNLWFFFTPIFYSVVIVPSEYRIIYDLNPLARLVESYRATILAGHSPALGTLIFLTAAAFVALAGGYYVFGKVEPKFADRV